MKIQWAQIFFRQVKENIFFLPFLATGSSSALGRTKENTWGDGRVEGEERKKDNEEKQSENCLQIFLSKLHRLTDLSCPFVHLLRCLAVVSIARSWQLTEQRIHSLIVVMHEPFSPKKNKLLPVLSCIKYCMIVVQNWEQQISGRKINIHHSQQVESPKDPFASVNSNKQTFHFPEIMAIW